MTKRLILILAATAIILMTVPPFLYYSNDHAECETLTETTVGPSGEKITYNKHVCKERFSF